jgi:hypothetical protein
MPKGTEVNDGTSTSQVNSYEYMTARETLRFTARFFYEGPRAEIERRVAETLDLVGLANKADRPIPAHLPDPLADAGHSNSDHRHRTVVCVVRRRCHLAFSPGGVLQ